MRTLHEILLLFRRKLLETIREPAWVAAGLSTPLLYLALFTPLLRGLGAPALGSDHVLEVFVPGVLALMAFGAGMGAGWVVVWELQTGVIERLRVTPTARFSLLLGSVLRDVVMLLAPALLVLAVAFGFGFPIHWAGLAVLFLLLSLLTAVVSAASGSLGMIFKNIGSLAAVVTGLQLPIMLLAGVLLPISIGPPWLRTVAHLNPMFYVTSGVWQAFAVMVPLAVLSLGWATRVYRKAVA